MNYTKKQNGKRDKYLAIINKILHGNPQRFSELEENEDIKNTLGDGNLKYWLDVFSKGGNISYWPPKDKKTKKVRYRLYFLPRDTQLALLRYYEDLGLKHSTRESTKHERLAEFSIELRKSQRTKKYQEMVLRPLFNWFKQEVMYQWRDNYLDAYKVDYTSVNNEKRRQNLLEYGPKYDKREFDVWTSPRFEKRDRDLENQFRYKHDPKLELFKMIDEFNIKYNDYWHLYVDINEIIREHIMKIMGLVIIDIGSAAKDVNEEKIDSVTTNLQFLIYNQLYGPIIPFDSTKYFPREDRRYGECIDAPYEKYEFWYGVGRNECLVTEKEKGRSPEQFFEETDKKIKKIITELRESKEVTDLYEKIRPLHARLEELEAKILRRLKNDLDKDVLDGDWDYLSPAKK